MVRCPECRAEVQPDWDWCHACGWDPEGLRPAGAAAAGASAARPAPPSSRPAPPFAPGIAAPPGSELAGYGRPAPAPGGPSRSSSTTTVLTVALAVGGAFVVLIVVLVLGVTFLGRSSTTRTTSFDTATGADPPLRPTTSPTTLAPVPTTVAGPWTTWTATDGSFHVDFPQQPHTQALPLNDPRYRGSEVAVVEGTTADYVLFYFDLAPGYSFPDPNVAIGAGITGLASSMDISVTSREPGSFNFLPSMSFTGTMREASGSATVEGVGFLTETRIYCLISVGRAGAVPEHNRFISSFANS